MRKITINAGPPMDRIVTEWLAHLVLAIPAGPDGGTVIFDGGTSNGTVVAQRRPGVWSVSFRPNPDGSRIRYYASPHVVAAVIIAGEHDETAAIDTTGHPVDVTEELLACTGHEPAQELAPHELAVWEFLTGLARRLEPGPYPASLVAALPSYHGLRDAVDPDQEHFKGPHVNGLGDALRAVSAYDAAHGRPTVAALVRRGGGRLVGCAGRRRADPGRAHGRLAPGGARSRRLLALRRRPGGGVVTARTLDAGHLGAERTNVLSRRRLRGS